MTLTVKLYLHKSYLGRYLHKLVCDIQHMNDVRKAGELLSRSIWNRVKTSIGWCVLDVWLLFCCFVDNQVLVNRTQPRICIEWGSRQDAARTLWWILYTCPTLHRNSCSPSTKVSASILMECTAQQRTHC